MKRFEVEVTRRDKYIIEIDEKIYEDPKWKDDFESSFWDVNDISEIAEHLAKQQARFGEDGECNGLLEGFGYVTRDGELCFSSIDFDDKGNWLPEEKRRHPAPGLNIVIVDEDNDIECLTTEL